MSWMESLRSATSGQVIALDVTMNEDMNRIRKDNAPENLAVIRRIAVSMVNQGRP